MALVVRKPDVLPDILLECYSCEMPDLERQKQLQSEKTAWAQKQLTPFQCRMCFDFAPLVKPLEFSKLQVLFEMNSQEPLPPSPSVEKSSATAAKSKRTASLADDFPWSEVLSKNAVDNE